MSATNSDKIIVIKTNRLSLEVSDEQLAAVMAALQPFTDPETKDLPPSASVLSIVPEPTPIVKPKQSLTPHDIAKLSGLSTVRVSDETLKSLPTNVAVKVYQSLAERAPSASEREEFPLGDISGEPFELKALANLVLAKMLWLIDLASDPAYVRKGLEKDSVKTTANPNHAALVSLHRLQQDLHRQEGTFDEFYGKNVQACHMDESETVVVKAGSTSKLRRPSRPGLTPAQITAKKRDKGNKSRAEMVKGVNPTPPKFGNGNRKK